MNNIVVSSVTQVNQSNLCCLIIRGDAYARGQKVNVVSAGVSEANRERREVATFATARFN